MTAILTATPPAPEPSNTPTQTETIEIPVEDTPTSTEVPESGGRDDGRLRLLYPDELNAGDSEAVVLFIWKPILIAEIEGTALPVTGFARVEIQAGGDELEQLESPIEISRHMSASLGGEGFMISGNGTPVPREIGDDDFAHWIWTIRALEQGSQVITVMIYLEDVSKLEILPEPEFSITRGVMVNPRPDEPFLDRAKDSIAENFPAFIGGACGTGGPIGLIAVGVGVWVNWKKNQLDEKIEKLDQKLSKLESAQPDKPAGSKAAE
ncbi:MAG: hypothetical protein IIA89_07755 [Chloroflexi bacterium]|nr:hypothetical protein [Chloroflexota bacterium]